MPDTSRLSAIRKKLAKSLTDSDPAVRKAARDYLAWADDFVKKSRGDKVSDDAIDEILASMEAEADEISASAHETQVGKTYHGPGRRKKKQGAMSFADMMKSARDDGLDVEISVPIAKFDKALGVVYGWASVTTVGGEPVVDLQKDVIPTDVLVKAVHEFMQDHRTGGVMHIYKTASEPQPIEAGVIVESIVLTADVQKALGCDLGKEGWFIGYKITDATVRKMVEDGELTEFSIGGKGVRVPTEIEQ